MTDRSLEGRSVIVTGGGTGIGAACARLAAAEGAIVTICGRTQGTLDAAADRIREEGGDVRVVIADVTVEEDVARVVATAVEAGGGLHGMVANAGGGGFLAPYHLQALEEYERVVRVNLIGTMLCVKHAVPHLARSGKGSMIGMSSIAGHKTHPGFGGYGPSKAGIEWIMRNAADEYGKYGVRFNAVQPGFISTEMMELVERDGPVYASYIEQTPLGSVGEPEDIAMIVRFLLSDESRWITGQTIAVDGGHSLRAGPDWSYMVGLLNDAEQLDPRNV